MESSKSNEDERNEVKSDETDSENESAKMESSGSSYFHDSPEVQDLSDDSSRKFPSSFKEHMKQQFSEVRRVWKKAIAAIKAKSGTFHNKNNKIKVFDILLSLFCGKHNIDEFQLLENSCDTIEMEYYVPQLSVFFLYGPHEKAEKLYFLLLKICTRSSTFAHRLYYYLTGILF